MSTVSFYTLCDNKEENPTAEEFAEWHSWAVFLSESSFNTSGMVYHDNNIKEQLDAGMSDSDAYNLLATTVLVMPIGCCRQYHSFLI